MSNELQTQTKPMPELSVEIIKKYICPTATDQEAFFFLQLCRAQGLNPFLREAYLIKYGTAPATLVTGKETFTKRADRQTQFNGYKAGIIVSINGTLSYREGSLLLTGETLLGGWSEVSRKDRDHTYRIEVTLSEYIGKKADGTVNAQWTTRPATMIRKVALVQSLREAFPDEFASMYAEEESVTAVPSADQEEQRPPIPTIKTAPPHTEQPQESHMDHGQAVPEGKTGQVMGDSTPPQHNAINAILKKLDITDDMAKCEHVSKILGHSTVIISFQELSKREASDVITALGKEEKEKNG